MFFGLFQLLRLVCTKNHLFFKTFNLWLFLISRKKYLEYCHLKNRVTSQKTFGVLFRQSLLLSNYITVF